jgi:hypothetical protein
MLTIDPYQVLGVTTKSTDKEIKHRYRVLARACHPDTNPGKDESEFKLLGEAYELISTQENREAYRQGMSDSSWNNNPTTSSYDRNLPKLSRSLSGSVFILMILRKWIMDYCQLHDLGYEIQQDKIEEGLITRLHLTITARTSDELVQFQTYFDEVSAEEIRSRAEEFSNIFSSMKTSETSTATATPYPASSDAYTDAAKVIFQYVFPALFLFLGAFIFCFGAALFGYLFFGMAFLLIITSRCVSVEWNTEAVSVSSRKPWTKKSS